jgi:hypothetical protein
MSSTSNANHFSETLPKRILEKTGGGSLILDRADYLKDLLTMVCAGH